MPGHERRATWGTMRLLDRRCCGCGVRDTHNAKVCALWTVRIALVAEHSPQSWADDCASRTQRCTQQEPQPGTDNCVLDTGLASLLNRKRRAGPAIPGSCSTCRDGTLAPITADVRRIQVAQSICSALDSWNGVLDLPSPARATNAIVAERQLAPANMTVPRCTIVDITQSLIGISCAHNVTRG